MTVLTIMSSSYRSFRFWVYAWLPVLLGMIAIAFESTDMLASENTSHPIRWLYQLLLGPISDARWELVHHYIRKSGHFVGYGMIGLAWLRAWWMTLPRSGFLKDFVLALLGTAAIASADEFHQSFLPSRTGSPWDVLLDCFGAFTMQLLLFIYFRLVHGPRRVQPD